MTLNKMIFGVIAAFLLNACATMHAQNCTENAGYEKGLNDAKMGRLMSMGQFAVFCQGNDVELAQKGYKNGYDAGKANQGGPQMNLTFENGKLGLAGAYNCQVSVRGQTISDAAATETQARNNVASKCQEKKLYCSESEIRCSKN